MLGGEAVDELGGTQRMGGETWRRGKWSSLKHHPRTRSWRCANFLRPWSRLRQTWQRSEGYSETSIKCMSAARPS